MSISLSNAELRVLQTKGWRFVQESDDNWLWLLYAPDGSVEAAQGDGIWHLDVAMARRQCLGLSS